MAAADMIKSDFSFLLFCILCFKIFTMNMSYFSSSGKKKLNFYHLHRSQVVKTSEDFLNTSLAFKHFWLRSMGKKNTFFSLMGWALMSMVT